MSRAAGRRPGGRPGGAGGARATLAVLAGAAVVAGALGGPAGAAGSTSRGSAGADAGAAVAADPGDARVSGGAPAAADPGSAPLATDADDAPDPPVAAPSRRAGSTVARIVVRSRARPWLRGPDPGPVVDTTTSWSHQPQTLLVLAKARHDGHDWVRVLLPRRPTGSAGWVRRDHVVLGVTRWWIDVRRRARTVTVRRLGRVRRTFRAVVGAPTTPTPTGLSAVWERNRQASPDGFVGSWVVSLTSLSAVLEDFGGGPGRIGLHGRGGASLADPLGTARSHGCVRLPNAAISWIAGRVPVGAPVLVRD